MVLVHLLLECSVAAPVRELMLQMYRNPSFAEPRLARYCESGEKATHRTPNVCSDSDVRGISEGASEAVEKTSTRGLYPVCIGQLVFARRQGVDYTSPIARNLPSGLKLTHVAALILSLELQVLFPGASVQSGDANGDAPMPASRKEAAVRLRLSFCVGVDGPPYTDADGFIGLAVGRARKKR